MLLVLLEMLLVLLLAINAGNSVRIRTANKGEAPFFYDEYGRVRIFHGINRVEKGYPWYYEEMLNSDAEGDLYESLGFNAIRLGWMWSGFEPAENQYNVSYFRVMSKIVERLKTRNVYTLLDMHQDVLSSEYCLYDGVPRWVIQKGKPTVKNMFPWPQKGGCSTRAWGMNYVTEEVAQMFQNIYDNYGKTESQTGMRDDLVDFWRESSKYWSNNSHVLGYELINEPFAGNFFKDLMLMVPGNAGRENLMPLYDILAREIRSVDPDHIIFYEPVTWGMIFNSKIIGSGFDHVPGDILSTRASQYTNTSAYSFHYYCTAIDTSYPKYPAVCNNFLGPSIFKSAADIVAEIGGAAMLTEFETCSDGSSPLLYKECKRILDFADQYFISWTNYYGAQTGKLELSANWTDIFSRTYAQAISGIPLNTTFNTDTKQYSFCWKPNYSISQPTIIYYNPQQYNSSIEGRIHTTNGLSVTLSGSQIYLSNQINSFGEKCVSIE